MKETYLSCRSPTLHFLHAKPDQRTNNICSCRLLTLRRSAVSGDNDSKPIDHHSRGSGCFCRPDPSFSPLPSVYIYSWAVSVMTHRWVTRRHFPPLLRLFEADTRMGHRHTPLPLTNTSPSLSWTPPSAFMSCNQLWKRSATVRPGAHSDKNMKTT